MVKWADIQSEYETMSTGYRQRVVEIFKKYEGEDTDEIGKNGRPILVSATSFARKLGIAQQTFSRWVTQYGLPTPDSPADLPCDDTACVNEGAPPRQGFVREVNDRLKEALLIIPHLEWEAHQIILDDIAETRRLLDQIENQLKESSR